MIKEYRTAIVTGASRGIGPYIAQALAKEGMNLVLVARNAADLQRVADQINAAGARALAVPADIIDRNALSTLISAAEAEFGAVDVLVNNAALDSAISFHKERPEVIEQILLTNLSAPITLTRFLLPGMLERGRGHIVNIATLAAKIPFPYDVMYATSKAGLAHFTTSLRAEYRGTGVSASVVLAGQFTDTGLSAQALKETGVVKPKSVPTSPPEAAGQAVINALKKDIPEIGIPAPAILFARIPSLGTLFLNRTGVSGMIKAIAEARGHM
ncbi:MAG: SDR family oxidoreductase [Chloroflexi bacterium]|nr:SDR family oxidoreductase [Chloroflexota bacterium]MCI0581247.1 SDR family oxidoreductase [Chloroflexota bacterium]MCI0648656.1 SDR family oxidoreductase [Chloroflexota bacterium]MCI0728064.1 SDR family oxidoreductase [Chloroflexota bacterium]